MPSTTTDRDRPRAGGVSLVLVAYRHAPADLLRIAEAVAPDVKDVLVVDNAGDPALRAALSAAGPACGLVPAQPRLRRSLQSAAQSGRGRMAAVPQPRRDAGAGPRRPPAGGGRRRRGDGRGRRSCCADGRRVNAGDNPLHVSGMSWSGRFCEPAEDGPPRDVAVVSGRGADGPAPGDSTGTGSTSQGTSPTTTTSTWPGARAWPAAGRVLPRRPASATTTSSRRAPTSGSGSSATGCGRCCRATRRATLGSSRRCSSAPRPAVLVLAVRDGLVARRSCAAWRALWRERGRRCGAGAAARQALRRVRDAPCWRAMTGALDTPLLARRPSSRCPAWTLAGARAPCCASWPREGRGEARCSPSRTSRRPTPSAARSRWPRPSSRTSRPPATR